MSPENLDQPNENREKLIEEINQGIKRASRARALVVVLGLGWFITLAVAAVIIIRSAHRASEGIQALKDDVTQLQEALASARTTLADASRLEPAVRNLETRTQELTDKVNEATSNDRTFAAAFQKMSELSKRGRDPSNPRPRERAFDFVDAFMPEAEWGQQFAARMGAVASQK